MKSPRWLRWLVWGYLVLFIILFLLRLVFFDRLGWVALINASFLYWFAPLLILIPLVLWKKQWRSLALLCFPLGIFISLYYWMVLPKFAVPVQPNQPVVTAMTFNMLWDNKDYGAIAQLFKTYKPDIVGLQEVRIGKGDAIAQTVATDYPYSAFHPVDHYHNVGLLSRFPIESVTPLPDPPFQRGLAVTVRLENDQPLQIIVAHLTPNYPLEKFWTEAQSWYDRRLAQAQFLKEWLNQHPGPTVVLCDCNFVDTSEAYAALKTAMVDSFRSVGWGFGHTMLGSWFPTGRIDFVWHTPDMQAIQADVANTAAGSDHLAAIAQLQPKQ